MKTTTEFERYQSQILMSKRGRHTYSWTKDVKDYWSQIYNVERLQGAHPPNLKRIQYLTREHEVLSSLLKTHDINLKNKHVLDIGYGGGKWCQFYRQQGARVVGIDLFATILKFASNNSPDTSYVSAYGEYLPFIEKSFDVENCIQVLQYLKTYKSLYHNAIKVLKEEGYFLVHALNKLSPWATKRNIQVLLGKRSHPDHSWLTLDGFYQSLSQHFKIIDMKGLLYIVSPPQIKYSEKRYKLIDFMDRKLDNSLTKRILCGVWFALCQKKN